MTLQEEEAGSRKMAGSGAADRKDEMNWKSRQTKKSNQSSNQKNQRKQTQRGTCGKVQKGFPVTPTGITLTNKMEGHGEQTVK